MVFARRCAVACALVALLPVACGDDGGPEVCTGTCIAVSNVSNLTVNQVNFTACGVSGWGSNQLGSAEIDPGEQRSWPVAAGCWDVQAVAPDDGGFCGNAEYGMDIAAGTTHVLAYDGCP